MRFCILITSFTDIALQFEGKLDFDPTFYFDRTFFVSLFFTGAWPDNLQIKETKPPCSNIIPTILPVMAVLKEDWQQYEIVLFSQR